MPRKQGLDAPVLMIEERETYGRQQFEIRNSVAKQVQLYAEYYTTRMGVSVTADMIVDGCLSKVFKSDAGFQEFISGRKGDDTQNKSGPSARHNRTNKANKSEIVEESGKDDPELFSTRD